MIKQFLLEKNKTPGFAPLSSSTLSDDVIFEPALLSSRSDEGPLRARAFTGKVLLALFGRDVRELRQMASSDASEVGSGHRDQGGSEGYHR